MTRVKRSLAIVAPAARRRTMRQAFLTENTYTRTLRFSEKATAQAFGGSLSSWHTRPVECAPLQVAPRLAKHSKRAARQSTAHASRESECLFRPRNAFRIRAAHYSAHVIVRCRSIRDSLRGINLVCRFRLLARASTISLFNDSIRLRDVASDIYYLKISGHALKRER